MVCNEQIIFIKPLVIYLIVIYSIIVITGGEIMCVKDKLKNAVDWIKISIYLMGFIVSAVICISSIITIPEKIQNHEERIAIIEHQTNDLKIEYTHKLSAIQEDIRIIKQALINK